MLNHVFTLCCVLLLFTGAVIVFTALLSVTFLNRKIQSFMWLGILFVVLGLVVVGIADVFGGVSSRYTICSSRSGSSRYS